MGKIICNGLARMLLFGSLGFFISNTIKTSNWGIGLICIGILLLVGSIYVIYGDD